MSSQKVNSWRGIGCCMIWMVSYAAGVSKLVLADGLQYWLYIVAMVSLVYLVATERRG